MRASALSAAAYTGKVFLYNGFNFFTTGFVGRQGERYDAAVEASDDAIPGLSYYATTGIDAAASLASVFFPARGATAAIAARGSYYGATGAVGIGAVAGAQYSLIQKTGELGIYAVDGYLPNGQSNLSGTYLKNTAVELAWSTVTGAGLGLFASQLISKSPKFSYKLAWNTPTKGNPLPIRYDPVSVSEVNKTFLGTAADPDMSVAGLSAGRTLTAKNGVSVALPNKESLNTNQAFDWINAQIKQIPALIKGIEGVQNQAIAANYWLNEFKIAMRQAMKVPSDAVLLSKLDAFKGFNEELALAGKSTGGNAKYKLVFENAKAKLKEIEANFAAERAKATKAELDPCFAAGTLVHTINGLVPIEQIKVGDLVLSQPEEGGEKSYKPVTQTFEHDFKEVMLLEVALNEGPRNLHTLEKHGARDDGTWEGFVQPKRSEVTQWGDCVIATPNHPFFAIRTWSRLDPTIPDIAPGWNELKHLGGNTEIETLGDTTASVMGLRTVWHAGEYGYGYVSTSPKPREWDYFGGAIVNLNSSPLKYERVDNPPLEYEITVPLQMTVYNIEVQDNHTYYVGTVGLWVHNKNTRLKVLSKDQADVLVTGENSGNVFYKREASKNFNNNAEAADSYEKAARGVVTLEGEMVPPAVEIKTPLGVSGFLCVKRFECYLRFYGFWILVFSNRPLPGRRRLPRLCHVLMH